MIETIKSGYKVCDAMIRKPITVTPDTSVKEGSALMREKGVGSLVIREDDQLKGYLTEQDIIRKVVAEGKDVSNVKVSEIMVTKVATIEPNQDIHEALVKMRKIDVKQLPVIDKVNGNKLVGLLTLKDVLRLQPQFFELMLEKSRMSEQKNSAQDFLEGTCDLCGEYFKNLYDIEGEFLCKGCKDKKRILV
ncbi:MAG: CBS domain-containing protein [bacterium]|nr:CBS domain-containing protein [bacterium]